MTDPSKGKVSRDTVLKFRGKDSQRADVDLSDLRNCLRDFEELTQAKSAFLANLSTVGTAVAGLATTKTSDYVLVLAWVAIASVFTAFALQAALRWRKFSHASAKWVIDEITRED
jgi:hypothetical protein